ncbi:hypothetical protein G9C85_06835 [Halorubellus sp. JP-L1]|uniref:hypothetical protein n=1 Tax=Halorubellus sp. JP-L1 TaxID=2715753 RepID=UPI00140B651A|nr:hypothetical protein [Halorubellus sp. JP-L1]NHN41352.1 hypothetical protein [Halorubellus sp. JP-L1]
MKRRELVAAGVSVVCAGVVGASRADEFESVVNRPDRLDGAGASSGEAEAEGSSSGDGTSEDGDDLAPRSTLEVVSTASGETSVRFRLTRAETGEVVHDRVRSMAYGERAYLSGLLSRGESFVFALAVDDATLVRETVEPGEQAVFELVDETTVSVVA